MCYGMRQYENLIDVDLNSVIHATVIYEHICSLEFEKPPDQDLRVVVLSLFLTKA